MLKKIPGNAEEDPKESWQRFLRMLKIRRFMMQLNENRIKGYILRCNEKCAQKLIKTSHMNQHVLVAQKLIKTSHMHEHVLVQ